MAKEYFERHGEYREFDPETKRITSIGFTSSDRFYYSVDTLESDIHFDAALYHEKLSVKRTELLHGSGTTLTSYTENGQVLTSDVFEQIPKTYQISSSEFVSIKSDVMARIESLNQ